MMILGFNRRVARYVNKRCDLTGITFTIDGTEADLDKVIETLKDGGSYGCRSVREFGNLIIMIIAGFNYTLTSGIVISSQGCDKIYPRFKVSKMHRFYDLSLWDDGDTYLKTTLGIMTVALSFVWICIGLSVLKESGII